MFQKKPQTVPRDLKETSIKILSVSEYQRRTKDNPIELLWHLHGMEGSRNVLRIKEHCSSADQTEQLSGAALC